MVMKILVVGGGGREHAIVRALARSRETEIFSVMARANPGIAALARGQALQGDRYIRDCSLKGIRVEYA
jgi:phosphoribosylamine--glycine ligase